MSNPNTDATDNVVSLKAVIGPRHFTVHIAHYHDGETTCHVEGLDNDDTSREWFAGVLRAAADSFLKDVGSKS